jgi:hypothetical protein
MQNGDRIRKNVYSRLALILVAIGLLFAVDAALKLSVVYKLWPLVIAVFGVGMLGIYRKTKPRGILYLGVGTYLCCFSVLALWCNFEGWARLGRLWPLFILFLGAVFVAASLFSPRRRFHLLAGLLLISLSAVFFLVFSLGASYWWTALILGGLSIYAAGKAK